MGDRDEGGVLATTRAAMAGLYRRCPTPEEQPFVSASSFAPIMVLGSIRLRTRAISFCVILCESRGSISAGWSDAIGAVLR